MSFIGDKHLDLFIIENKEYKTSPDLYKTSKGKIILMRLTDRLNLVAKSQDMFVYQLGHLFWYELCSKYKSCRRNQHTTQVIETRRDSPMNSLEYTEIARCIL